LYGRKKAQKPQKLDFKINTDMREEAYYHKLYALQDQVMKLRKPVVPVAVSTPGPVPGG
jgi:hypothetical protein